MTRRPPRSTSTYTLFPYPTLFRYKSTRKPRARASTPRGCARSSAGARWSRATARSRKPSSTSTSRPSAWSAERQQATWLPPPPASACPVDAGAAVVRYSWHVGGAIVSKEEVRGGPGSSHLLLRRHHDMGGLPAGAVDIGEHDYAHWETRADAILLLLDRKSVV